jgi:hypothetical protein
MAVQQRPFSQPHPSSAPSPAAFSPSTETGGRVGVQVRGKIEPRGTVALALTIPARMLKPNLTPDSQLAFQVSIEASEGGRPSQLHAASDELFLHFSSPYGKALAESLSVPHPWDGEPVEIRAGHVRLPRERKGSNVRVCAFVDSETKATMYRFRVYQRRMGRGKAAERVLLDTFELARGASPGKRKGRGKERRCGGRFAYSLLAQHFFFLCLPESTRGLQLSPDHPSPPFPFPPHVRRLHGAGHCHEPQRVLWLLVPRPR